MSIQCCVKLLEHVIHEIQSESCILYGCNNSVLEYCSKLINANPVQRHVIQDVWSYLDEEIDDTKYPRYSSICRRVLQSDLFQLAYTDTPPPALMDKCMLNDTTPNMIVTRIQLLREVTMQLEQELYRQCSPYANHPDRITNPYLWMNFTSHDMNRMSSALSVVSDIVARCTTMLECHRRSEDLLYNYWFILLEQMSSCKIQDKECLNMCNHILTGKFFNEEMFRLQTDARDMATNIRFHNKEMGGNTMQTRAFAVCKQILDDIHPRHTDERTAWHS